MRNKIMPISIIIASIILSSAIIFYAASNRFYIDTSTQLIVDRLTGKVNPIDNNSSTEENLPSRKQKTTAKQYLKNIDDLVSSPHNYENFEAYYLKCVAGLKVNNLKYEYPGSDKKWAAEDFEGYEWSEWCPLFKTEEIQKYYNEFGDTSVDEFIEYVRSEINNQ